MSAYQYIVYMFSTGSDDKTIIKYFEKHYFDGIWDRAIGMNELKL